MPKGKYIRAENWKPHNYKQVSWSVSENGCWICDSHRINVTSGYHEMNRGGKIIKVHRYMYEKYKGKIPEGLFVCHKCDNKSCINPAHLFVDTPKGNTMDMIKKKRNRPPCLAGEKSGKSKLTNDQIISIRNDNRLQKEIAKDYDIKQCHVSRIKRNISWRCVP